MGGGGEECQEDPSGRGFASELIRSWEGEVNFPGMGNCPDGAKGCLVETRVGAVRGGRSSKGKVINIREIQTVGEGNMQGRKINSKQEGRNRGTLWGADRNRREDPRVALQEETAGPACEEGLDPSHKVVGDALGAEGLTENVSIHIVEPSFDVQKERGDLAGWALVGADCVDKSRTCVERGEGGERATLVGIKETHIAGHRRESPSGNSLKDFVNRLEEDDDSERGWGVVRGFAGFVKYHTVCHLEGGGEVAEAKQGSKERREHGGGDVVHSLPDRVGDRVGAMGRRGGAGS